MRMNEGYSGTIRLSAGRTLSVDTVRVLRAARRLLLREPNPARGSRPRCPCRHAACYARRAATTQSRFDPARARTKILTMNNERGESDDRPFLDRSTAHAVVSPGDPSFGRPTARAVRAWAVAAARLLGGVLDGAVRVVSDRLSLVYHLAV